MNIRHRTYGPFWIIWHVLANEGMEGNGMLLSRLLCTRCSLEFSLRLLFAITVLAGKGIGRGGRTVGLAWLG